MNNPAQRLHDLLKEVRSKVAPNKQTGAVWEDVLDTSRKKETPLFLKRLAKVLELPAEVIGQLEAREDLNQALFQKWRPNVENALIVVGLTVDSTQLTGHLDDVTMLSLQHCAEELQRYTAEADIDTEQLESLMASTRSLMESTENADIDVSVKVFILEKLQQVDTALSEYGIAGPTPLRTAAESCIGSCYTNAEILAKVDEKEKPFMKKFFSAVKDILLLLRLGEQLSELPEKVEQYLP